MWASDSSLCFFLEYYWPYEIGERYDLEFIATFGSYGMQRFSEESDIDVAFYAKREMDYATEEALLIEIIQYFRRDKIDLINLRKASILLKKELASNGKVLWRLVPGCVTGWFFRKRLKKDESGQGRFVLY